jgi:hypothetical protein
MFVLILRDAAKTPLLRMRAENRRNSGARAKREPGISQTNIEIPGLRLPAHPGMTDKRMQGLQL